MSTILLGDYIGKWKEEGQIELTLFAWRLEDASSGGHGSTRTHLCLTPMKTTQQQQQDFFQVSVQVDMGYLPKTTTSTTTLFQQQQEVEVQVLRTRRRRRIIGEEEEEEEEAKQDEDFFVLTPEERCKRIENWQPVFKCTAEYKRIG
jgi:hypothetical protein